MKEYKERIHSKTYKANTDLSLYSAGIEQCKSEYTYGPIVKILLCDAFCLLWKRTTDY